MKGENWEQLQAFRRGWRDGACSRAKRKEFVEHPTRHDLKEAYGRGYDVGHAAMSRDVGAEAERLGINLTATIIDR